MKAQPVERFRASDYMKRSLELKNSMERSFDESEWNSCVINAIHCAISAADAFCIYKKGLRSAGDNHRDAIALFISIDPNDEDIRRCAQHLSSLISIKTDAEYGDRLLSLKDAETSRKHASRLYDYVKSRLPG